MKSLNVEIHLDKTGIDRDKKVAQLDEQGASKKRIGQTLGRWLGWTIMSAACASSAHALPDAPSCRIDQLSSTSIRLYSPTESVSSAFTTSALGANLPNPNNVFGVTICRTVSPPDSDDSNCEGATPTFTIPASFYQTYIENGVRCSYHVMIDQAANTIAASQFLQTLPPTAVPVFTPIGLIATISGLLWFGRRRKAMKITQGQ